MTLPCFRLPLLAIALMLLAATSASAQTAYGTILGSITDPSAGAIPGASVRITNIGTNISKRGHHRSRRGICGSRASYPGSTGWRFPTRASRLPASPALTLLVNQNLRFDAVLEPGTVETVVEVTAVGTLIETDTSSVGKVVENKQIVDLPMVSRNFTDLIVLSPATVTDNQGALANEQSIFRTGVSGGGLVHRRRPGR